MQSGFTMMLNLLDPPPLPGPLHSSLAGEGLVPESQSSAWSQEECGLEVKNGWNQSLAKCCRSGRLGSFLSHLLGLP